MLACLFWEAAANWTAKTPGYSSSVRPAPGAPEPSCIREAQGLTRQSPGLAVSHDSGPQFFTHPARPQEPLNMPQYESKWL